MSSPHLIACVQSISHRSARDGEPRLLSYSSPTRSHYIIDLLKHCESIFTLRISYYNRATVTTANRPPENLVQSLSPSNIVPTNQPAIPLNATLAYPENAVPVGPSTQGILFWLADTRVPYYVPSTTTYNSIRRNHRLAEKNKLVSTRSTGWNGRERRWRQSIDLAEVEEGTRER